MRTDLIIAVCLLFLANASSCQVMCDCDGDGITPTILDALTAAQLAAGALTPSPAQLLACDISPPVGIDVLDALVYAQGSAGLPVTLACSLPPGAPTCAITVAGSPAQLAPGRNLVAVDVQDPNMDPLTVTLEISTGASWVLLGVTPGSPTPNPAVGVPSPSTADFLVDLSTFARLGVISAQLRVTVDDGTSSAMCSLPILLNTMIPAPTGSSVAFLVDRSCSMGWGLSSVVVPGVPGVTPWQAAQFLVGSSVLALSPSESFALGGYNHTYNLWMPGLVAATAAGTQQASAWLSAQYASGGTSSPVIPLTVMLQLTGGPPAHLIVVAGTIGTGAAPVLPPPYPATIVDVIQLGGGMPDQFWQDLAAQNGGLFRHYP